MSMNFEAGTRKVVLPRWIWEQAKDKEDFKRLVMRYMERYPDYIVKGIKDGLAVCVKK